MHLTIRGSERMRECIFMAAFSQDKIRRIVSDMEHKSWKRKNNTGVPEEVIHHPGAGVEVPLLHFPLLEKTGIVKEGFTTRLGGVSEGIFSTMNLSFTRGDEEEAVRENYRRLASALDVDYDKFVFTDQTHTTNVRKVTAEDAGNGLTREREFHDTDGLITDVPGLVLSTFYADCVPLYFPMRFTVPRQPEWLNPMAQCTGSRRCGGNTEADRRNCAVRSDRPSVRTATR